jgi:hypothetical protein
MSLNDIKFEKPGQESFYSFIIFDRSYLKNRKIVRGQGRRRIVTGGIYANISRITIQAGRRDRAIWHF